MYNKTLNISRFLLLCIFSFFSINIVQAENKTNPLPVFDAHIHYSHDVWDAISPADAIRRLREAGVKRALVSSSSDEGTQRLYQADPAFIVPSLRPYRKRGTLDSWMYDESIISYLKERLAKYRYAAIGEFHIDGEQARTPVMREVIRLAKQYKLILHVHSDAQAINFIIEQDPKARILWAHAGFENAEAVRKLMSTQANLWADLSFRTEIANEGRFFPGWKELLVDYADRFLLGIDTYEPQRWLQINNVMKWQRDLLAALPDDVARKVAYENGERLMLEYDKYDNKD